MSRVELPEEREIGRVVSETAGPTVIVVAGIHGNEPAGIEASRRVLRLLERRIGNVRGELVALAGNLGAMRQGKRFRARDMNRVWTEARVADVEERASRGDALDEEDLEQLEILAAVRDAIRRARGPVFLVDMHTTSAHGLPFILFGDTLKQRAFASPIPLPICIGLQEQVDGVLCSYWTAQGCTTFSVEGGQHDDPGSIDNLEAVLLLAADSAGLFGSGLLTETVQAHALLERRRGNIPRVLEVTGRHAIAAGDDFVMTPGFQNLARVKKGQLLANDRNGAIRAPRDGFILMPLYQGQGADGFFWGRELSPARLRIEEVLRTMNVDRFLDLLPGVKRRGKDKLVLDSPVSRLVPMDVFQTFGYRRVRSENDRVTVERQPEL
jgi:predicted deacylase